MCVFVSYCVCLCVLVWVYARTFALCVCKMFKRDQRTGKETQKIMFSTLTYVGTAESHERGHKEHDLLCARPLTALAGHGDLALLRIASLYLLLRLPSNYQSMGRDKGRPLYSTGL